MKNETYTFSVPKPCTVPWSTMTVSEKGRYCQHCAKEVQDFSSMTDGQIIKLLKGGKERICGRFKKTQLHRPMQLSPNLARPSSLKVFLAGALFLSFIIPATIEAASSSNEAAHTVFNANKNLSDTSKVVDSTAKAIRGTILDKVTKTPVEGVTVYIVNGMAEEEVQSDSAGNFTLYIPDRLKNKKYTVTIVAMGYNQANLMVDDLKYDYTKQSIISLTESESEYMKGDTIIIIQGVK